MQVNMWPPEAQCNSERWILWNAQIFRHSLRCPKRWSHQSYAPEAFRANQHRRSTAYSHLQAYTIQYHNNHIARCLISVSSYPCVLQRHFIITFRRIKHWPNISRWRATCRRMNFSLRRCMFCVPIEWCQNCSSTRKICRRNYAWTDCAARIQQPFSNWRAIRSLNTMLKIPLTHWWFHTIQKLKPSVPIWHRTSDCHTMPTFELKIPWNQ